MQGRAERQHAKRAGRPGGQGSSGGGGGGRGQAGHLRAGKGHPGLGTPTAVPARQDTKPKASQPPERPPAEPDAPAPEEAPAEAEEPGYIPTLAPCSSAEVDLASLSWFPDRAAATGEGLQLGQVMAAYGKERLDQASSKLLAHMADRQVSQTMCRLTPQGSPHDTFEAMRWFPASWAAQGVTGEALRQHGSPWLFVSELGTCRYKPVSFPFYSQACYMFVGAGEVFVMAWKTADILAKGTTIADSAALLADMSGSKWEEFCKNVHHMKLSTGQGLWVPNGVQTAILTLGDRSLPRRSVHSHILYVPIMSGSLLRQSPDVKSIVSYASYNARLQLRSGTQNWMHWVADYLQWLSGVDEEAAKDGDATGAEVEEETLQPHRP
jgi:hypothetical protein